MPFSILKNRVVVVSAVVAACVLLPVYVAEIALAARLPNPFDPMTPFWAIGEASEENRKAILEITRRFGVAPDTRRLTEVMADMRAHGHDVVPATQLAAITGPGNSVPDGSDADLLLPLGGISNRTTLLCNQSGQYVSYESDEHGFRNPRGIWRSRRFDVAVVGQSFAQGYCVEDGKTFVDDLRSEYSAVANLGWSGQGPLLQLGAIKEYLPRYSPRIVLWVFQEGIDLQDLHREEALPIARRYLEREFTQRLLERQSEIDTFLQRYADRLTEQDHVPPARRLSIAEQAEPVLKLWHLRTWVGEFLAVDDAREVARLEQFAFQPLHDILQQARDISAGWGGQLHIVYLPSWRRYQHHASATDVQRAVVLRLAKSLNIPVIDAVVAFRQEPDSLSLFPFRVFGHYNAKGNRLVGQAIQAALERARDVSELPNERTSGLTH